MPLESPSLALAGFPDGRWLIADTNGRDGLSGRLFAPVGTLLARLDLGDAIEYLGVDSADHMWVGWFDEGISHNMGRFRATMDQTAVVAACFAVDGVPLAVGPVPDDAGLLADVCAMTVTEDGAWVCPYTEFPLLHLRPGHPVRWWRNELFGVEAIATDGIYTLLAGGYGDDAARLALVELDGDGQGEEVRMLASWRLPIVERVLPEHEQQSLAEAFVRERQLLLAGRGAMLHLVTGGT